MSTHLRHVTSNSFLPGRGGPRLGSRSPGSIPSSPTSVYSSSSAIFERDIEPISCSPLHRTPRSKQIEQQSVPSVLDSAAAILASSTSTLEDDRINVLAPAGIAAGNRRSSGFSSPIGSYGSRSPSPTMGKRTSLLIRPPLDTAQTNSPPNIARVNLSIQTTTPSAVEPNPNASTSLIVTPTSAYYSAAESGDSCTTTLEHPPTSFSLPWSHPQLHSPLPPPLSLSHPPSPSTIATTSTSFADPNKCLSFMSYSDLLASTPISFHLLSSLTTAASTSEPPPHIPILSGIVTQHAPVQQQHAFMITHGQYYTPSHSPRRGTSLIKGGERDSMGVFDDLGGEWQREGMSGGLEERLEAMLGAGTEAAVTGGIMTPVC